MSHHIREQIIRHRLNWFHKARGRTVKRNMYLQTEGGRVSNHASIRKGLTTPVEKCYEELDW